MCKKARFYFMQIKSILGFLFLLEKKKHGERVKQSKSCAAGKEHLISQMKDAQ